MTTLKEKQLFESFQDKDYRDIFVEEHIGVGLAHQIRALRDKNGWTQEELSNRAGKKQPVIAQLENPDYGNYTLKTLKTLASAFDVALQVDFVSFSELIKRASNLTPEIIAPPDYSEESRSINNHRSFKEWLTENVDLPEKNDESRERVLGWRNVLAHLGTEDMEETESITSPSRAVIAGIDEEFAYANH